MLIPVTVSPASESNPKLPPGLAKISHDEIALIELQGLLEVEASRPEERDGKFVGKLNMDNPTKPTLLIGHHLLEGKIATLTKPLAILARSETTRSSVHAPTKISHHNRDSGEGSDSVDDHDGDSLMVDAEEVSLERSGSATLGGEATRGWTVVGVVKKKIIFSKRPMPVIPDKRS